MTDCRQREGLLHERLQRDLRDAGETNLSRRLHVRRLLNQHAFGPSSSAPLASNAAQYSVKPCTRAMFFPSTSGFGVFVSDRRHELPGQLTEVQLEL